MEKINFEKTKLNNRLYKRVNTVYMEYLKNKRDKDSLLKIISEVEAPESVYNSNAIENSTLTLDDTERILMDMEVSKNVSLRELNEAQNLNKVMNYVESKSKETDLELDIILFLHKVLLNNINDDIAGRLRKDNEWVRVGKHIGSDPRLVEPLIIKLINIYKASDEHVLVKAAKFHRSFELIHPFIDGNGRMGRVIINYMLLRAGYTPIIVRDKDKQDYYQSFKLEKGEQHLIKILVDLTCESLHKRLAYMKSLKIVTLDEYGKSEYNTKKESASSLLNKAYRQTIPAFRERGIWKIGVES